MGGTDADGIDLICANCHEDVHDGPFGGKTHVKRWAPETNARRAETMRKQWADPEYQARMANRKARSRVDDVRIRVLRVEGRTKVEIAALAGCSYGSVVNSLNRSGGDPLSRSVMQLARRERERSAT